MAVQARFMIFTQNFLQLSNTEESTIKSKDEQWKFKEWTKEKRAQQDIKAECVKKPKPSEKNL